MTKDAVLTLRLTETEMHAAKAKAQTVGLPLSEFVRRAIGGEATAPRHPVVLCDKCGLAIVDDNYRTLVDHITTWDGSYPIQHVRYAHDRCLPSVTS